MNVLTGFHIAAGAIALCAAGVSLTARKGHRWHRLAGSVFVGAMLLMAASSVYLAVVNREPDNILVGSFTFYLVLTAWCMVRRTERVDALGIAALGLIIAVAALSLWFAVQALDTNSGLKDGTPAGNFLAGAVIATTFALFDIRLLIRRHLTIKSRLVRHFWRMCLATFIAALSFFFGQAHLLPEFITSTGLNWLPMLAVLCVAAFWCARFTFGTGLTKRSKP